MSSTGDLSAELILACRNANRPGEAEKALFVLAAMRRRSPAWALSAATDVHVLPGNYRGSALQACVLSLRLAVLRRNLRSARGFGEPPPLPCDEARRVIAALVDYKADLNAPAHATSRSACHAAGFACVPIPPLFLTPRHRELREWLVSLGADVNAWPGAPGSCVIQHPVWRLMRRIRCDSATVADIAAWKRDVEDWLSEPDLVVPLPCPCVSSRGFDGRYGMCWTECQAGRGWQLDMFHGLMFLQDWGCDPLEDIVGRNGDSDAMMSQDGSRIEDNSIERLQTLVLNRSTDFARSLRDGWPLQRWPTSLIEDLVLPYLGLVARI